MTQDLGLSHLDVVRRDRLTELCDLYAEALDAVVAMMMSLASGRDQSGDEPELVPQPIIN